MLVGPWNTQQQHELDYRQFRRLLPPSVISKKKNDSSDDSHSDDDDTGESSPDEDDVEDDETYWLNRRDQCFNHGTTLIPYHETQYFQTDNKITIKHKDRVPEIRYEFDDWPTYTQRHVSRFRDMLTKMFPESSKDDQQRWNNICWSTWLMIHQSPLKRQIRKTPYTWQYHLLVTMSQMRQGYNVPVWQLDYYGTKNMYEKPPITRQTIIERDPYVDQHFPVKRDLQRIYTYVKVIESSNQHITKKQKQKHKLSQFAPIVHWSNKLFNKCLAVQRSCLVDYCRVLYHHP